MKPFLIIAALVLAVLFLPGNIAAQKKQRIGLEEGTDYVQVEGKISGRQYALYEVYVGKGDVWDVSLSSPNDFIGYTVKAPNGDRVDFLEPAPRKGFYTIRVELNASGAKSKKVAFFTLKIKFEMEKSKPIS